VKPLQCWEALLMVSVKEETVPVLLLVCSAYIGSKASVEAVISAGTVPYLTRGIGTHI